MYRVSAQGVDKRMINVHILSLLLPPQNNKQTNNTTTTKTKQQQQQQQQQHTHTLTQHPSKQQQQQQQQKAKKQYKCCTCKKYRGKGMEGENKKCLCVVFWLTRRSRVCGEKKSVLGHPIARATSYCFLSETF